MEIVDDNKNLFPQTKIGLYQDAFGMAKPEYIEVVRQVVNNRGMGNWGREQESFFHVLAGQLVFRDLKCEDAYCLVVDFSSSEKKHRGKLLLDGFNSGLCSDYADTANQIASDFCIRHGFRVSTHLNSWPIFQAIVVKESNSAKDNPQK